MGNDQKCWVRMDNLLSGVMPSNDKEPNTSEEQVFTARVQYPEYILEKQKLILKFNIVGKCIVHVPKCIKVWL